MSDKVLVKCPYCDRNWIAEDGDNFLCSECNDKYVADCTIVDLCEKVKAVDKLNFNALTSQHRTAIRSAATQLEAILNVIERYKK